MQADALALEALLLGRAYLYELFHKAFGGEPSEDLLAVLCRRETIDVLEEYEMADETMFSFKVFLEDRLSEKLGDSKFLESVKDEYYRLFFGLSAKTTSPCESVYRSEENIHFTVRTLEVREAYRLEGLLSVKYPRVPDDHISLEAKFLSTLAQRSIRAFRDVDRASLVKLLNRQKDFLARHLTQWTPFYASEVRKTKTNVLYPQLVTAATVFFKLDLIFVNEALAWIEENADIQGDGDALVAAGFADFELALEELRLLRLTNLEDNEFR